MWTQARTCSCPWKVAETIGCLLIRLVETRRCTRTIIPGGAAAVAALHAVFRDVKEDEGVDQSQQFGLGQALIDEGVLRAGDGIDILGDIHADEAGVAVVERVGQVGGAGIERRITADPCRGNFDGGRTAEVTIPQVGAAGDMIVVVAPDDEGLVVQPGIFQDGHHGVQLAGSHPVIFKITIVDDKIGMQAGRLVDGGGEVFRLVPAGPVPMRIPQGYKGEGSGS